MTETIPEIIARWESVQERMRSLGNAGGLWSIQAGLIAKTIRENAPAKALEILRKDLQKYGEMGIALYLAEAVSDLEQVISASKVQEPQTI